MKIIHTALRYPPATGGVETYVKELVERTRNIEAGRDVRVLTSAMRTHGPVDFLDPEELANNPMYVQRLSVGKTPLISYPRLEALAHYLGHHKPDIVHGHSFWYQPADTAARYARKHHVPFFFHPMYYDNAIRQKKIWQLYKHTIGRQTFAAADVVITLSPFEQRLIAKAGFPVKRFAIIPPGIDKEDFLIEAPNPFLKRGIRGHVILAVNRLAEGKGLQDAITALSTIVKEKSNAQLVLVGEDFGYKSVLLAQVKQLGISDHVHFLGKLSRQELLAAYQHANMFVHTSEYEAFGIAVLEAMAAGLPIVARNTSAIPDLAPHDHSSLLFTTMEELTQAITTLMNNQSLSHHLRQQAQERANREYTWDASIKKLLALYQEYGR